MWLASLLPVGEVDWLMLSALCTMMIGYLNQFVHCHDLKWNQKNEYMSYQYYEVKIWSRVLYGLSRFPYYRLYVSALLTKSLVSLLNLNNPL